MAEAKRDAIHAIELMKERYQRILSEETNNNGLVIIVALYGNLANTGMYKPHFSRKPLLMINLFFFFNFRITRIIA